LIKECFFCRAPHHRGRGGALYYCSTYETSKEAYFCNSGQFFLTTDRVVAFGVPQNIFFVFFCYFRQFLSTYNRVVCLSYWESPKPLNTGRPPFTPPQDSLKTPSQGCFIVLQWPNVGQRVSEQGQAISTQIRAERTGLESSRIGVKNVGNPNVEPARMSKNAGLALFGCRWYDLAGFVSHRALFGEKGRWRRNFRS